MKVDKSRAQAIEILFAALSNVPARKSFPRPLSLADELERLIAKGGAEPVALSPAQASMFATAAIDAWQRGVHSLLISASLTKASPIWSSVAGYYSSHYSVRAIAHSLGIFMLFRRKRVARIELDGGAFMCHFEKKNAGDREHRYYWRAVRSDLHFANDPLFPVNATDADISDVAHRNRANYSDHLQQIPDFRPLSVEEVRSHFEHISTIEYSAPPIPERRRFPDLPSVQVVAYLRVVRFRQFLDSILGGDSQFWNRFRTPTWVRDLISFQLVEQRNFDLS